MCVVLLAGLLILSFPRRAELGRTSYGEVKLDEVLSMAPTVVVVRPDPAIERETIELGEGIDPFAYQVLTYQVVEFLRPPRPNGDGETIAVTGFDPSRFDLHVRYHAYGEHKSPIWQSYSARHPPGPGEEMVLFLRRGVFLQFDPAAGQLSGRTDTFMPVVVGAVEGPGARSMLERRAGKPCECTEDYWLTVGYPGEPADSWALNDAIQAHFGEEEPVRWNRVDLRPQRRE